MQEISTSGKVAVSEFASRARTSLSTLIMIVPKIYTAITFLTTQLTTHKHLRDVSYSPYLRSLYRRHILIVATNQHCTPPKATEKHCTCSDAKTLGVSRRQRVSSTAPQCPCMTSHTAIQPRWRSATMNAFTRPYQCAWYSSLICCALQ